MESLNLKFASSGSLLNVNLNFVTNIDKVELKSNDSLLVVGKKRDLEHVKHEHLASKLTQLQIPKEWFDESLRFVSNKKTKDAETSSNGGNSACWLNKFIVHTISGKYSRHNTPSRAHLVTKAVRQNAYSDNQIILVVCERQSGVANACAVARAFPLFSAKTSSTPNKERNVSVSFLFVDDNKVENPTDEETNCFNVLSKSIRLTARIVETPCADMTTNHFLDEVNQVAKELGITPFVIEGEELLKQGFGGLYNVGKAAVNPPKLVVLSSLKPGAKRTVAWVGKGIVFDTGGLCIKSRPGMCGMKVDCGGAAGILGAFYSAVKLGFEDNLHAVLCLAENSVAANSCRPDDIITLYSGKTIEITNTDAEGRLVLGDGVAYAEKDLKADVIVDMATLTSAQGTATGRIHAAVLTNSEEWEKAAVEAGKKSADLCFPIIFAPEVHFAEFNTEMADMRNSVLKADNAPCSCAGLFIHSQLSSKYDGIWIHIDMASPVMDGERGTGYGVAILNSLFGDSSLSTTLKSISPGLSLPLKQAKPEDD